MVAPEGQWYHHLRSGNLTRETEIDHLSELLARDPLVALVRNGLIAFRDDRDGQLKFEEANRSDIPRRLPDGPPISAQSTWDLCSQEFLLRDTLSESEVRELTLSLKPCVQIPEVFDPISRLVDPGVTLYR